MPDLDILIATPAAHGMVTTRYAESLFELRGALAARGIRHSYQTTSFSDIDGSRNLLASGALAKNCTHLLFIDSDMGFRSRAVARLIDFAKPVVGAICPKRQLNLFQALDELKPEHMQQPGWQKRFVSRATGMAAGVLIENSINGGFARFSAIGMAVTLIACEALRHLIEAGGAVEQIPVRTSVTFPVYGFFDRIRDGKYVMPEDFSFCRRWSSCGGEIWGMIDEPIVHVGPYQFIGTWADANRP